MTECGPDLSKSLHSGSLVISHGLFSAYVEKDGEREKGRLSVLLDYDPTSVTSLNPNGFLKALSPNIPNESQRWSFQYEFGNSTIQCIVCLLLPYSQ